MTDHPVKRRKKLIEVAIPLEAINAASAREKSIRHGHPSTLHLWWARRPLAAARAVIFCQMVDDPSAVQEEFPTEEAQENERLRLFALISELVQWENTTNEEVLNRARQEIRRSWRRCCADNADHPEAAELFNPEKLPGFHDPFAGGGALPLEAQRLGLEAYASDLNPVAVLINKAMIEIPPKFAGQAPVNPESRRNLAVQQWKGAKGLAEDVRYYGQWMRDEAEKRIGHLYPKVKITPEMVSDPENPRPDLKPYEGQELTVIAWLWARTVKSPNPAFSKVEVPLTTSFVLSSKAGKQAYVEPEIQNDRYSFRVRLGVLRGGPASGTKLARGSFRCLLSGAVISYAYIDDEAEAKRLGARLMAVVAEGPKGRVWLSPSEVMEKIAHSAKPAWKPEIPTWGTGGSNAIGRRYGFHTFGDYFTPRQLAGLTTLADLVLETREKVKAEAIEAGMADDKIILSMNGCGADAYADGVAVYLAFMVDQVANHSASVCGWNSANTQMRSVFARQVIPMTWDYAECNIFSGSSGSFNNLLERQVKAFSALGDGIPGNASIADAASQTLSAQKIISTDPPYYDNIAYADLSDFFYAWLRPALNRQLPDLFATITTPKAGELVALPYRHANKVAAGAYFLAGMSEALALIAKQAHPAFPLSIYYAFKQSDTESNGTVSTGWDTFLEAVICAGLELSGTWPMRTEKQGRVTGFESNALASSIVLVCRKRPVTARTMSRSDFRRKLKSHLPMALSELEAANIAPVDVAQAAIGPGMSIFSSAKAVLNPDDSPMSVRDALIEINAALDEYLSQDEGDLDSDSRFALTFFESFGYAERDFGDAENLAKARNVSVAGVAEAGVLRSIAGKVKLLQRTELEDHWDPSRDKRLCVWEATQHLIKRLEADGEGGASALLLQLKNLSGRGDLAANCRALAYRLYNHCEKTKQAEEARAYNGLVIAWPELERLAAAQSTETAVQASLI